MKDILALIDKGLALLPFNGHKTNTGMIITFLGAADVILQASIPLLHAVSPIVPPVYLVGIGATVTGIGAFHQFIKKLQDASK